MVSDLADLRVPALAKLADEVRKEREIETLLFFLSYDLVNSTEREIAAMTNAQLFQASKDLYNSATVKQASRLAKKVIGKDAAPGVFARAYATVRRAVESAINRLRGFRIEKAPEEKPVDNSHLLFMTGDGNG